MLHAQVSIAPTHIAMEWGFSKCSSTIQPLHQDTYFEMIFSLYDRETVSMKSQLYRHLKTPCTFTPVSMTISVGESLKDPTLDEVI